jgi:hypothetical protein
MKQTIAFKPVFTPGAAGLGTLDFSRYPGFTIGNLYAVINVTRNIPIYVPGTTTYAVTSIVGSTLFLTYNTSQHSGSDQLMVFYDTAPGFENNYASERGGQLQMLQETSDQILVELKVMNLILAQGLNIVDNVDALRNDLNKDINRF